MMVMNRGLPTQVGPEQRNLQTMAASMARSTSAPAETMKGALPLSCTDPWMAIGFLISPAVCGNAAARHVNITDYRHIDSAGVLTVTRRPRERGGGFHGARAA